MTQLDLAFAANSSTRHLSYVEIGRAKPSREMVMRLAECLDVPLRERNVLLFSAGFAAAFEERPLADIASVHQALDRIVQAHKPYPAFAVDRNWDIVLTNRVLPQLYVDVSPELLRPPVNAIRLMLHPFGMAPRIVNLGEWHAYIVTMLRPHVEASADAGLQSLLAEIMSYPSPELATGLEEADLARHDSVLLPGRLDDPRFIKPQAKLLYRLFETIKPLATHLRRETRAALCPDNR